MGIVDEEHPSSDNQTTIMSSQEHLFRFIGSIEVCGVDWHQSWAKPRQGMKHVVMAFFQKSVYYTFWPFFATNVAIRATAMESIW